MKKRLFAACMAAALLLAGCGAKYASSNGAAQESRPASSAVADAEWSGGDYWDMNMGGDEEYMEPNAPMESGGGSIYQNVRAKLIRRAELSIQTEQFDQSAEALDQLVSQCGGYFENASVYGGGRRDAYANRRGEYIVRVPAGNYDQFLSGSGDLGYVTSKTESSEDVGEQYYDTEARLKTQRTKQERLLALLEKAESMEDIIALESALSDVEYQIEQYSSTLNRYDALIGFSTFTIYLNEVGKVTQEVGETASLGTRMAAGFQASVQNLGRGFQDFLVWASYNIFLLAVLAVAVVGAVVVGRRGVKKLRVRKPQAEKKTEEE